MDTIVLSGKKELDIYINPQRQNLLRCMRIAGAPMTPKQLSDQLGISASAVQHHIKKLVELGIVGLSHTERIHGIMASYYKVLPKTVSIGCQLNDKNDVQRFAFMQNTLNSVFSGFAEHCQKSSDCCIDGYYGDLLSGIAYLGKEEAQELYGIIRDFLDHHEEKSDQGMIPWEYAFIAYPLSGEQNE